MNIDEFIDDVHNQARIITILLYNVNPRIDFEVAYDLLLEAIPKGVTEKDAADLGALIANTSLKDRSNGIH